MSNRKPLISGNWKMNENHLEAINLVQKLAFTFVDADYRAVDVSVHPPFTALRSIQTMLDADDIPILLGAQDCYWEEKGAFTGEVSAPMLAKLNVKFVIVGHSERRQHFGETDETVAKKLASVIKAGMTPILCVGETIDEREAGETESKVLGQLEAALKKVAPESVAKMVVAYEPIWAIGTGRNATPDDAQAVAGAIRGAITSSHGSEAGAAIRIQYGGSVKADTAPALMGERDVDGLLVGGASLDAEQFAQIVRFDKR